MVKEFSEKHFDAVYSAGMVHDLLSKEKRQSTSFLYILEQLHSFF